MSWLSNYFADYSPQVFIEGQANKGKGPNAAISTSSSGAPTSAQSSLSSGTVVSNYDQQLSLLDKLIAGFSTSLNSAMSSALDKEFAASAAANQAAQESADKAMTFTKEQNEINRIFQKQSAEAAMKFSAEEAEKNRNWQENMSNTSYQRAIADLQAAGLNPILAYTQGGASTPAGSAGSGYSASGSAGSGSAASAYKADAAGGKNADTQFLYTVFNSAAELLKGIGSIIPDLNFNVLKK